MKITASIALALILVPTLALATPKCDASDDEKAAYIELRTSMPLDEDETATDGWMLRFFSFRDESAERLTRFCAQNPKVHLWVAFNELFAAD